MPDTFRLSLKACMMLERWLSKKDPWETRQKCPFMGGYQYKYKSFPCRNFCNTIFPGCKSETKCPHELFNCHQVKRKWREAIAERMEHESRPLPNRLPKQPNRPGLIWTIPKTALQEASDG